MCCCNSDFKSVSANRKCRLFIKCPLFSAAMQRDWKTYASGLYNPRTLEDFFKKTNDFWASLVAQWLRIRLPMQGTRVRALVQEDLTCRRAAKPVSHNY